MSSPPRKSCPHCGCWEHEGSCDDDDDRKPVENVLLFDRGMVSLTPSITLRVCAIEGWAYFAASGETTVFLRNGSELEVPGDHREVLRAAVGGEHDERETDSYIRGLKQ